MRISYRWLRELVDLTWSPAELAERLTMVGLEVESVETVGPAFDGVVVASVLHVRPHPGADRLTLCSVDLGSGDPVQIVCGAPNVAPGQLVPVATTGATLELPDRADPSVRRPVTLSLARIRGEESCGMICAEDELGLSDDHSGIMVLEGDARVGEPFAAYLERSGGPGDVVLDVSITPNRPDAVSHIGVARDVAALCGVPLRPPQVVVPVAGSAASDLFSVAIESPDGCHRYVGLLVHDVTVADSPDWMQRRLAAIGLRPRNNVVDITNYVMHECGQPLHAFDFDRLAGSRIVVRRTDRPTPFTTLDGRERRLPAGTLMIADAERDVAIAGIMGGENSEVTGETRTVLIESAWFEPSGIRRSARALGLASDASYRFERGVDPELQAWAAARAAGLMEELAGGKLVDGMVDAHPVPHTRTSVAVRSRRLASILGTVVPDDRVEQLLTSIGFGVRGMPTGWMVTVPGFRPDVEREIDVIEEVARLHGLQTIPEPTHARVPHANVRTAVERAVRERASDLLVGFGLREIYTNSLLRSETAGRFRSESLRGGAPVGAVVETLNPVSQEMAALRPSLLPGALQVIAHNLNHGQAGMGLFEFGTVFDRSDSSEEPVAGFRERTMLLVALSGEFESAAWDRPARPADPFDLRGLVEALLEGLGVEGVRFEPFASDPFLADPIAVYSQFGVIGMLAATSPALDERFDLRAGAFFAEIDFTRVEEAVSAAGVRRCRAIPRFPSVDRDLAVVVDETRPVGPMIDTIRSAAGELLRETRPFDVFRDERIGAGRKSVAFSLRFASDRTLRDDEVDHAVSRVVQALEREHGAVLR